MQKNQKRLIFFLLSSLLLVLFVGVVSAQGGSTNLDKIVNKISGSDLSISGIMQSFSTPSTGFLQILIFVLVALIVYGVTPFFPILNNNVFIRWGVTLIVAYLSTYTITIEQIRTILLSYSAMGILLTAIIPFFIIAAISKKAQDTGHGTFVGKILWILFFLLILYRWAFTPVSDLGTVNSWIFLILIILTIIMFFVERWVYFKFFKAKFEGETARSKKYLVAHLTAKIQTIDEELANATPDVAKQLTEKRAELKKALDRANQGL